MKKNYLVAIVFLVVIGVVSFLIISKNRTSREPSVALDVSEQTEDNGAQVADKNTVVYTNTGYSPTELTVQTGTTVVFVNQSDLPMWTASNPHPVHTDFAGFDARRGVDKGKTYEFTFEESGTYDYHNHMASEHTGTIVVE